MENTTISFSIVTGIISGILTSILTFIFYKIYKHIFIPWYIKALYRGVDISGTWRGGFKTNDLEVKALFNIKQDAFNLRGVFYAETTYLTGSETNYSNQYQFKGHIKNNTVIINYEAMSDKRTGMGTFMLDSSNGGNVLKGKFIHSEDAAHMWAKDNFIITRD